MTENFHFTNDWFLGNVYGRGLEVDIVSIWNQLLKQMEVKKILEIGAFEGRSTVHLAQFFPKQNVSIFTIDTWGGSNEHHDIDMGKVEDRFDKNMRKVLNEDPTLKITKMKMDSVDACTKLISSGHRNSFDFIYIDGSHRAADVLTDACLCYQLGRKGCLIIFDDYLWNYGFKRTGNVLNSPKLGIDAFTNIFSESITIIHGLPSYQLYILKSK